MKFVIDSNNSFQNLLCFVFDALTHYLYVDGESVSFGPSYVLIYILYLYSNQ